MNVQMLDKTLVNNKFNHPISAVNVKEGDLYQRWPSSCEWVNGFKCPGLCNAGLKRVSKILSFTQNR